MKVIVAVIFAIGHVSALGSGPYLPSGWTPQGPAFYLPGEVQNPADNPLKETIIFEEASGSDALREYGPPKVQEIQDLTVINQGLPDVATEQTFLVVDNAASVVEENLAAEVSMEQKSEAFQEATTEQSEETPTETISKIVDIELQYDATTVSYEAEVKSEVEATTVSVEAKVEQVAEKLEQVIDEKLEQVIVEEVSVVEQEARNIAEALINLENEIKEEQVLSVEAAGEVRINQEGSGSTQVPEGFLEYGPPGFREYGPPKGDELLRTAAVVQESSAASIENNEARRRRFSPKFRLPKSKRTVARH